MSAFFAESDSFPIGTVFPIGANFMLEQWPAGALAGGAAGPVAAGGRRSEPADASFGLVLELLLPERLQDLLRVRVRCFLRL